MIALLLTSCVLLVSAAVGVQGSLACGTRIPVRKSEFEVPTPNFRNNQTYTHAVPSVAGGAGWISVSLCNASHPSNDESQITFGFAVVYQQQPDGSGKVPLSINLAPEGASPQKLALSSLKKPYRGGLTVQWPDQPINTEQAAMCGEPRGGNAPNVSGLTYIFNCSMLQPQKIEKVTADPSNLCNLTVTWKGPYGCAQPQLSLGWVFLSFSLAIYPMYLLIGSCLVYCWNGYLAYPMRGWWTRVCRDARRGLAVLHLAKPPQRRD